MRKLKLFFACLLMAVLSIGQVWGAAISVTTNPTTSGTFTITAAKASGQNAPIEASGCVRLYANNTLTIETSGDANITGMTIAWTKNGSKAFATVTTGTGSYTHPSAAGNGTWTGSAKEIVFNVGSSGQIQITSVDITVEEGGGSSKDDLTDEQLSWSAASANITFGDEPYSLPSLTNSIPVSVTYQSTDETVATISDLGAVSVLKAGSTTIKAVFAGDEDYNAKTVSYTLTVAPAPLTPIAGGIVDEIKISDLLTSGSGYQPFSDKQASNEGHSDAVYAGKVCISSTNIQMNTIGTSTSAGRGIATTTSGGNAKRVQAFWGGSNTADRKLTVYGSNTAYAGTETAASGTKLGDLTYASGDSYAYIDITGDYAYLQIVASGAIYMSQINITWVAPDVSKVATPEISGTANFYPSTSVSISCSTDDAAIYYTTDGTAPTSASTLYEGAFTVNADGTTTVKAIAVKDGMTDSDVAEQTFTKATVLTVASALSATSGDAVYVQGTITSITEVNVGYKNATYVISDISAGVKQNEMIVYRGKYIGGADFTSADQIHVGDVVIVSGTIGVYQEKNQLAQGNQIESITPAAVVAPVFSPDGGGFMGETDVTITCATGSSTIYYTLDGTNPTKLSTLYEGAIHLTATTTITAIAYVGEESSLIVAKEFTLTAPMTVAEALAALDSEDPINNVAVAGIISTAPSSNPSSGKLTYFISDDGSASDELEVYKGFGVAGASFSDKTDLQVGDVVTVFGNLTIYNSTKEFAEGSRLIAFNRPQVDVESISLTESTAEVEEGKTVTLHASVVPANATNKTINWSVQSGNAYASVADGVVTGIAEGTAVIRAASDEDATIFAECTVTVTEPAPLSPWATVYTSNVELSGSQNVKVTITVDEEDKNFDGVKMNKGAAATFTIPAGTTHLYAHMAAWNGEGQSVTVSGDCFDEPKGISIIADANVSGSGTTFDIDDAKAPTDYFKEIVLDKEVTEPTEITITAASGKRFVLFGVNQVGGLVLESIAISGTATELEYNEGDHFDPAGLVVMGHYSNGSDAAISDGIDWAFDPDPLTEGTTSVSVTATVGEISSDAVVVNGLTVAGAAPVSPWATVYTSNVELSGSQNVKVTITVDEEDKNFDGVKMNKAAAATFTIPAGTTNLYAHMAAWNGEAQTVTVSGDCFDADKSIDIVADANVSGSGTTFDIDDAKAPTDYFKEIVLDKEVTEPTEITITAASGKRFVLFGVNQVGGVLPVLKSIEISGDLTTKSGYKAGDALDLDGLTVSAIYTLNDVDQAPVDVTSLVNWSYDPLEEGQTSVTITATLEDKTDDITISDLEPVASADPKIYVSTLSVDFGSVEVGEAVPANETVTVTLTNVAAATATLGGTNPEAFSITPAALTTSGDITISILANTDAAATYSATLTISDDATENPAQSKTINLSFAVIEPVVNDEYELVSDVASLAAGDQIIIVAENEGDYYTLDGSISSQYFPSTAVSISAGIITAPSTSAIILGKDEDNWTMSMGGQLIGATAAKKASLGNGSASNTWTIAIAENVATITNTAEGYGSLQFNYNSGTNPRFLNYTSTQTAVAIYKKVAPEPPTPATPDYTRPVTSGNYGTICLPKAGTIEGASIFEIAYYGEASKTIFVDEITSGHMGAGVPYIFQATAAQLKVTYDDKTDVDVAAGEANGLFGFYDLENMATDEAAQKNLDQDEGNYILYNNQYWLVSGRAAYINNFRAYIKLSEIDPKEPALAPGRRRVAMAVNGENAATGFENIESGDAPMKVMIEGTMYILRGEKVYDATGRLVK